MTPPGDRLLHVARLAHESAWIVSPFIKSGALQRVLSVLNPSVRTTVVTRWRLDELAIGVSDLAVFDDCKQRPNCRLLLCDDLHAKYFRMDAVVLIGSANLTGAGMGWSLRPNVEILEIVPACATWSQFESILSDVSVPAIEELRDQLAMTLAALPPTLLPTPPDALEISDSPRVRLPWIPLCRNPEAVRCVYFNDTSHLVPHIAALANRDLVELGLPAEVPAASFKLHVRCALLQQEFLREIDSLITDTPRFGDLRARLSRSPLLKGNDRDPTDALQCIMRWLVYFLPDRYEIKVFNYSECLRKRELRG